MKTSSLMVASVFLTAALTSIQAADANKQSVPAPTAYREVERGANHKVWQRQTYEQRPDGKVVTRIHKYTELASGMHYQNSRGEWVEAKEEIETTPGGAVARQGQHQVIFANNLNSYGAIDLQTPDGKRLRSNVLGLGYTDKVSGESVLIAQIHDSQGELISDNQVLYPEAFEGVKADVRYTYKKGSFEQDVILREQPPAPEVYGLNSETTELEVITEFLNPPVATIKERKAQRIALDNEDVQADQDVAWGTMRLGRGKAFDLADSVEPNHPVSVQRRYESMNGRNILLEIVPVKNVQDSLQKLPLQSSSKPKVPMLAAKSLTLPATPLAATEPKPIRLAAADRSNQGFVLDYIQVSVGMSNLTFQGDTTYLISGAVYTYGTLTLEGGTVIKYDTRPADGSLQLWGNVICATDPYRPAIFTSFNDNSVGENLSVAGTPTYYDSVFSINASGADINLHDLRFSYTYWGLHPYGSAFKMSNVQFTHCNSAFYPEYCNCVIDNILMCDVDVPFGGMFYNVTGYNMTIDGRSNKLSSKLSWSTTCYISLVNSLLVNVGVDGDAVISTNYTARLAGTAAQIFQTVGGGNYYLPTNSPYRNAGTTNFSAAIKANLATKTTYAPVYFNIPDVWFYTNLSIFPQVPRDADSLPDMGYHYAPLDYIFSPIFVTNATITINPGTAVGFYGVRGSYTYGIGMKEGGNLICKGEADKRVQMLVYNLVQEQSPTNWVTPSYGLAARWTGTNYCRINSRFTDWSCFAQDANLIQFGVSGLLDFQHSQFHGGMINLTDYVNVFNSSINFTNCLFERVLFTLESGGTTPPVFRNNLVFGGEFDYSPWNVNTAVVADNLFDKPVISYLLGLDGVTYLGGHNAYVTNYSHLPLLAGDVILPASPAYQTGTLGRYYLPTNTPLINAGTTTANQVGLYHFTTQTNQVKEANSQVDIGYHYVATDANGNPIDTNGNGIPDYIDDTNGNGLVDNGENGWNIPGDFGFNVYIIRPRNGTTVP